MLTNPNLQIPIRAQNLPTLLERVLNLARREQRRGRGVRPVILGLVVQEAKLVVVDDGRVEGADGELQAAAHVVDPGDALQPDVVLLRVAHVDVGEALLDPRLQNVRLCDFDVGWVGPDVVVGCGCHGGVGGKCWVCG